MSQFRSCFERAASLGFTDTVCVMATGLILFSLVCWVSFVAARLFKDRGLPELLGFLVTGMVLGPAGFGLLSSSLLSALQPAVMFALGSLMFIIGRNLSVDVVRKSPWMVSLSLLGGLMSAVLVYGVLVWVNAPPAVALMLAALSTAGAPMTVASILRGRNDSLASGLVGAHALADAMAVLLFALFLPLASGPSQSLSTVAVEFVRLGLGGAALGVTVGFIGVKIGRSTDLTEQPALWLLVILTLMGWAAIAGVSFPLAALTCGAVVAASMPHGVRDSTFYSVQHLEAPLYLIFFTIAGASLHLSEVPHVGLIGLVYVTARIVGKVLGGFVATRFSHLPPASSLALSLDMLPQAGVAVGLALLAEGFLADDGVVVATVVLGSVVLFELIGPLFVARHMKTAQLEDYDSSLTQLKFPGL